VKICAEQLAGAMTSIINHSFQTNTFPCDMKKAEISPIFKKNCPMSKENYRPINILGVFSKLFESIIADQINGFMQNYFNDLLGAYRKGHGCSHVLTFAVDTWKKALDRNQHVAVIFMDLSKAFDSIPHELLVIKLKSYGFSENACLFMKSYLSDRIQRVKSKDTRSSWETTKKGIPQGSCLGPLLFNVFINDMFPHIAKSSVFNYADDNSLSVNHVDIEMANVNLVNDTNIAIEWFERNFLKANPDKFQLLLLSPFNNNDSLPTSISINDSVTLKPSLEVKLLGVNINNKLNFDNHVKVLCKKASQQLKVLYRFKNILGFEEKKLLFNTFIMACFNFCPINSLEFLQ
jgi:hypothetical protein